MPKSCKHVWPIMKEAVDCLECRRCGEEREITRQNADLMFQDMDFTPFKWAFRTYIEGILAGRN
ncbi:MAG: hypothetical protein F4X03_06075 [Dehalococcoidia bacterium]|nr:hypothetical protein [Chloroflexota bacterium]MXX18836.1 hypothetical protein [Dehalococcoidia bacterium]MYD28464.1 hypothetical protein [Dehalococcoidia bacterium]